MIVADAIVDIILAHEPQTLAIYLYGSYGTADEWPDSDVDLAILLPPVETRQRSSAWLAGCRSALMTALGKSVDLVIARDVSTVLQKEIVATGRLLLVADSNAVAEFEMLTLSLYQKLNDERREILEAFHATGRAYDV